MFHSRVLKEIKHIKGSEIQDNESVISHSRSSVSYQFNKTKFSKPIQPKDASNKNTFHLDSVIKAKSRQRELNDKAGLKKTSRQNSLSSLLDREPIELRQKKKLNRNWQEKLKKLMENVKSIQKEMKQLGEMMWMGFEKIKEEMQVNLMKVTEQIVKVNGSIESVSVIHEILNSGFEAIKKVAVNPLESLSQLNWNSEQSIGEQCRLDDRRRSTARQLPLTPLVKGSNQERRNTDIIFGTAFSTELISAKCEFKLSRLDLNSNIKGKGRAETERKTERGRNVQEPEQVTEGKMNQRKGYETMRSTESTHNIESIITQMREILNE